MKTRKLHNLTVSEVGMGCMAFSHGYGQIPSEQYSIEAIRNGYSMVERDSEAAIIPYCMAHDIGFVPFSPIASGLLSGKITPQTQFESYDDVRNWVPQLSRANIKGNQPIVDLLKQYAEMKQATPAQISLAWMLNKYPNVVPIPGSKNKERIVENLNASNVALTDEEFKALEASLTINGMPPGSPPIPAAAGHRNP